MNGAPAVAPSAEATPDLPRSLAPGAWQAAALYLLVACVLLRESVFGGQAFFYRDVFLYWLPSVEGFVRAVAGGEWPLWDPHIGFGKPILADPAEQVAYLPTWLNLLMGPAAYYVLFLVLHAVWGGLGARKLALQRGLTPLAATAAGALWSASGPIVSSFSLWHHYAGATWLPWVLIAFERVLERPTAGRGALLGTAAAAQTLAGSADLCLMTALLALLRLVSAWRERGSRSLLQALAVAPLVAAGLAAVQWWPTLETIPGSARTGYSPESFAFWSLHPARLVEALVPLPLGGLRLSPGMREALFEGREPFIASLYLGGAVASFAGLALLAPLPARLGRLRRELLVAGALLLLLALGRHAPAYSVLGSLPGFDLVRYPVKYTLPASLVYALLAGVGWAVWQAPWDEAVARRARRLGGGLLVLAACMLAGAFALPRWPALLGDAVVETFRRETASLAARALTMGALPLAAGAVLLLRRARLERAPAWLTAAAFCLAPVDLVGGALRLNPTAPAALVTHEPSLLAPVAKAPEPARLHVLAPAETWRRQHLVRAPPGWSGEAVWALGQFQMMVPPIAARWGVDGSYAGELTGQERIPDTRLSRMAHDGFATPTGTRLLRLAGVSHVVSIEEQPYPGLEPIDAVETVYDVPVRLFRVLEPLPRAYAVSGVEVAAEPAAYDLVRGEGFDPRTSVILPEGLPRAPRADFVSEVAIAWRRANSVALSARLSSPGTVVLLDGWYPGWTARVDGVEAPVLRANLIFRGVAVPEGRHEIEFRYRPPGARWGAWLSAATCATLGLGAALARRRS